MKRWGFLAAMTALLAAAFLLPPGRGPALCLSRQVFGLPCPGCGMMRSVSAFAQGRIEESIRFHLFGPLVFAALLALWGAALAGAIRRRDYRTPDSPAFNAALGVALVLLLGYWAARAFTGTIP